MVRFGIMGFGLHAEKRLAEGFRGAHHARLVALSRREAGRAGESAKRFDVPHAFGSKEELCACPEVDAVIVATPNACHCADTLLALARGKPVLCEKPMATNAAECRRMIAAAQAAHLPLGAAQVFRFHNSVCRLRERVGAGDIGRPIYARAEFCIPGKGHPRRWMYNRALAGGGVLADLGVHCIDLLRFVLQDEVVATDARAVYEENSGDVETAAGLLLQFGGGAWGAVGVSSRSDYRTPAEIVGEEGALLVNPALSLEEPVILELRRDGKVVETERLFNASSFSRMLDGFALAVEGRQPFSCPGEEGLQNQLVLDAAYAAIHARPAFTRHGSVSGPPCVADG
jgi:1,5-anhydro-D-fructose reductase (1,5-anhydro-D-mannitol-forming)